MSEKNRFGFPSLKFIALAAIVGMIAGAAVVYMKEQGSGNGVKTADLASVDCGGTADMAAKLKPFAKGQLAALIINDTPRKLPDLSFVAAGGGATSVADFAGKVQLVNLWATWCVPCREEMPALNNLQKAVGGKNFQVTAINIDHGGDEKPKAFLAEIGVDSLPLYHDGSMKAFNAIKKDGLALGLPATMLIDAKGCLLAHMNGPAVWDGDEAKALVRAAIKTGV